MSSNAVSSLPHTQTRDWHRGTGSHGNLPPSNTWGAPEVPQPPLHNRGEKQELGLGLEEVLLSSSITAQGDYPERHLPSMQEHLLSCWKAAAQQSGSPKHKHHVPRACKSAIFFGIHSLTTTTSLVQGSSTSSFLPAVRPEKR